jgi:hypothetical protein
MSTGTRLAKASSLGLPELAAKINQIDVMDSTLKSAREKILQLRELRK